MIRRSPTRIELKLEDLNDFDYIQKFEKKKNPAGTIISSADAQKLIRQERIGLGFRPIRSSSNIGTGAVQTPTPLTPPAAGTGAIGNTTAEPLTVVPVTPGPNISDEAPLDMNITNNTTANDPIIAPEVSGPAASNSAMSFDESL